MIKSHFLQFFIALVVFSITNYTINSFSYVISFTGSSIVLAILSWKSVKYVRRYYLSLSPISAFNRAVLITGCDSGFGNRLALRLSKYGFRVYATVLDPESDGAKQLSANGMLSKSLIVIKMDVTNDSDVRRAFDIVNEDLQVSGHQLWAVVNNAGTFMFSFVEWGSMESYQRVCDVNLFGAIRVTRTFLPLIRQSKGRIVNVSSTVGALALPIAPQYSLSKAALIAFSDSLRREMSKCDVRVAVIMPAAFKTPSASAEYLKTSLYNEWRKTDESVQRVYDQIRDRLTGKIDRIAEQMSDNVDLVIDAMSDAIINEYSEASYVVSDSLWFSLFFQAMHFIPTAVIDTIIIKLFDV